MIPSARAEGRGTRSGPLARQDGSVTVEAAGLVLPLLLFLFLLLSCLSVAHAQFVLTTAARDAARAASLQAGEQAAQSAASAVVVRTAPGAAVRVRVFGDLVEARVTGAVRVVGLPTRVSLSATSTMLQEP